MDQSDRMLIRSNTVNLMEKIQYNEIAPLLVERGLFTRAMVDDIEEPQSESEKLLRLLHALPTRGPDAFQTFLQILVDGGQLEAARFMDSNLGVIAEKNNNYNTSAPRNDMVSEPPTCEVTVRKASVLMQARNTYKMTSIPRGLCLIINNAEFRDSCRNGSEVDVARAERVFSQLGFNILPVQRNLTATQMYSQLKEFSKHVDHRNRDAAVIIIMSHGSKDIIYDIDYQPLSISVINNLFNNVHCSGLVGKPKMFFIQACRGGKIDYSYVPEEVSPDAKKQNPPREAIPVLERRTIDDILIVQPSAPDFAAFLNKFTGSWLISTLVDVLTEHAYKDHLMEMINEVDRRIEQRVGTGGERQTTSITNIGFNKFLYFNPGL